jgi:hypothetical protein
MISVRIISPYIPISVNKQNKYTDALLGFTSLPGISAPSRLL